MIRILHLEDDQDIIEISRMALEMTGDFELLQCSSGDEALSKAVAFKPDVLLLDVMMPGMSGPEALAALRQLSGLEQTPAIFVTARVQKGEVNALIAEGASKVIAKPFDPLTLGSQIAEVLNS